MARPKRSHDLFRWFDSSPEVIRLVVMMSALTAGRFTGSGLLVAFGMTYSS